MVLFFPVVDSPGHDTVPSLLPALQIQPIGRGGWIILPLHYRQEIMLPSNLHMHGLCTTHVQHPQFTCIKLSHRQELILIHYTQIILLYPPSHILLLEYIILVCQQQACSKDTPYPRLQGPGQQSVQRHRQQMLPEFFVPPSTVGPSGENIRTLHQTNGDLRVFFPKLKHKL